MYERDRQNTPISKKETTFEVSMSQMYFIWTPIFLRNRDGFSANKLPVAGFHAMFEYQNQRTHLHNYKTEPGHSKIKALSCVSQYFFSPFQMGAGGRDGEDV